MVLLFMTFLLLFRGLITKSALRCNVSNPGNYRANSRVDTWHRYSFIDGTAANPMRYYSYGLIVTKLLISNVECSPTVPSTSTPYQRSSTQIVPLYLNYSNWEI